MPGNYLIIHKSVLPDYYEKVLKARRLLESGKIREVSEAVPDAQVTIVLDADSAD